ncbi:MAG: diacylglycerol kinase [Candidatus Hydrogenedentales bacterium]
MPNRLLAKDQNLQYNPLHKIRCAANGFWFAVVTDFSVAYKVVVSVVTLALAMYYAGSVDVLLILVATSVMLMAELFNTAIEAICDYFETGYDEKIGAIKDVAAAAASVCIVVWFVVIAVEVYRVLYTY